jgi:hypothetical protein
MNFTNFTDNKTANQDITLFYNWLAHLYSKLDILNYFGLSGQAATALQDEDFGKIKNITFITNSLEIMNIVRNDLSKNIKPKGVFHQKENSYFEFSNLIIDVYYFNGAINFVTKEGFNCQDLKDIPNFLK